MIRHRRMKTNTKNGKYREPDSISFEKGTREIYRELKNELKQLALEKKLNQHIRKIQEEQISGLQKTNETQE